MFKTTPVSTSADFQRIGVGLKLRKYATGHVGLLYRQRPSGAVRMCHLANHRYLITADANVDFPAYVWARTQMPLPQQELLADWCPTLAEHDTAFMYSPHYAPGIVSATTSIPLAPPAGEGLTCATFVLDVFEAFGFQLIDLASWKRRDPEDGDWLKDILDMLSENDAEPEHLEAVRTHQLAGRFRPSEVATAVASRRGKPLQFEPLISASARVEATLLMPRTAFAIPGREAWSVSMDHKFEPKRHLPGLPGSG